MKNKFNIVEGFVPATPRSQRKKNAAAGGGSTIVVEGSGEGNSSLDPNSHTHTNLPLLESLADQDGYLTRKEVNPDTAEDADPFVYTKVNAGFADKAGDSEKWNGKPFDDYLDQPVRREDAVEHKSVTVSESVASKDFRQGGVSGSGFGMYIDANGNAVAEVDIIKARKEAVFNTAVINQVTFQVGATVFSNGGCEIARVEELDDVYRCYYDTKEDRRFCGLVVEDQARCQQYDPSQNRIVKYYWRLVVAVGEDYVDLSKTDVDGTGVPESGDEIAQFGHRTDKTRQSATIIDPKDGSSVVVYSEINSYSLEKKNFVGLGTNPQTGRPYLYCYGDFFLGDRELKNQFLTFQIPDGQTVPQLIGELNIKLGAGSSGLNNLTEWADKQQHIDNAEQTASDAQDTANTAQEAANEAQRDIANMQIGGVNLIRYAKKMSGTGWGWGTQIGSTLTGENVDGWAIGKITGQWGDLTYTGLTLKAGRTYTLSAYVRYDVDTVVSPIQFAYFTLRTGGGPHTILSAYVDNTFIEKDVDVSSARQNCIIATHENPNGRPVLLTNEWHRMKVAIQVGDSDIPSSECRFECSTVPYQQDGVNLPVNGYIYGQQIEEGNKATALNESPDDIQEEIDKVQQSVTDLEYLTEVFPNSLDVNGVVLAQLLGVKSSTASDAAVVAGIYGGSDETLNAAGFKDPTHGILMWFAGATNVQSAANAKTRVYGDGSIFTQMLYADGGKIGGFDISKYYLQANEVGDNTTSMLYMSASLLQYSGSAKGLEPHTMAVNIGTDTVPAPSGIKTPIFIKTTTSYLNAEAAGLYIDVQNSLGIINDTSAQIGSHALMIAHGDICGLRLRTRRVKVNTQLSNYDNIILCVQGSGQYTLTLPADPDDGHVIMTKSIGGSYTLKVGATGHYINNGRINRGTTWGIGDDSSIVILIWDEVNKLWHGGYTRTN